MIYHARLRFPRSANSSFFLTVTIFRQRLGVFRPSLMVYVVPSERLFFFRSCSLTTLDR